MTPDKKLNNILRYANGIAQDKFNEGQDIPNIEWVNERIKEQAVQLTNLVDSTVNNDPAGLLFQSWQTTPEVETEVNYFTIATDGITVPENGVYEVYASFYMNSTAKGANASFSFTLNGIADLKQSASAYITGRQGDEEGSTEMKRLFALSAGDKIGVIFYQMADLGTVTLPASKSLIILKRIK